MPEIEQILRGFPKLRPALPTGQQAIYEQEYLANREGGNLVTLLAKNLESWMHRKVSEQVSGGRLLEIGAGTLNQVPYMRDKQITHYDVVEPGKFFYANSPYKSHIRNFHEDIDDCAGEYDAVFSVAVLEHLTNLPYVLAKTGSLLAHGGIMVNAVPSEGGLLWGAAWRLITGPAYRLRTGYSYKNLMRHEHVNELHEIEALHRYFFEEVTICHFPLPHKHLSFYSCLVARRPRLDQCRHFTSLT